MQRKTQSRTIICWIDSDDDGETGSTQIVCFNKVDLAKEQDLTLLEKVYENCGHIVKFISVKEEEGIDEIRKLIHGKTTVLAGPSGVGKSSLMNLLQPEAQMETGEVSEKIKRGRHTTRHSELIRIEKDTFVLDTRDLVLYLFICLKKTRSKIIFRNLLIMKMNVDFQDAVTRMSLTVELRKLWKKERFQRSDMIIM